MPNSYTVGASAIQPYSRVFDGVGGLRLASASEIEQGITTRNWQAGVLASVAPLAAGSHYPMIAAGAISAGADVYRAANGRVSASGTSKLGRAVTSSTSAGDVLTVEALATADGGGGGSPGPKGLQYRGAYNSATSYVTDDVVTSGGSAYIAIAPSVNQPVTNAAVWELFASVGSPGPPGSPGGSVYATDRLVVGTNNLTLDNAAIAAAVSELNTQGFGKLWFAATVTYNQTFVFSAPIDMEGLSGHRLIEDGVNAKFQWGTSATPLTLPGAVSIANLGIGEDRLVTTLTLQAGDLVAIWADNAQVGITPHNTNYEYRPGEIFKISGPLQGAANTYRFGDFIDDAYTSNPKIIKLPAITGVRVKNLNIVHKAGTAYNFESLTFRYCDDVCVEGCKLGFPSGGRIDFKFCYNFRVINCTLEDLDNREVNALVGYGVGATWSARGRVSGNNFRSFRHAVTTGGQETAGGPGTLSYGNVRGLDIHDNSFDGNGTQLTVSPYSYSGRSYLDTHTQARRMSVTNNTFHCPSWNESNSAITMRSRDVVITGNRIYGTLVSKPIRIYSNNVVVLDNLFDGGWYNDIIDGGYNPNVSNVRFEQNTIKNFAGPGLLVVNGTGHAVVRNTFVNCGYLNTQSKPRACVAFEGLAVGGVARLVGNEMPKASNLYSIHTGPLTAANLELFNNVLTGYGGCSLGFDRTLAPTLGIENKYRQFNGVQQTFVVSVAGHGLTTASVGFPIDVTGAVWDDTAAISVMGILVEIVDADTLCLATTGSVFDYLLARIAQTYSPSSDGRKLWFDKSASGWKSTQPIDSTAPHLLLVANVSSPNFTAQFIGATEAGGGADSRLLGMHDMGDVSGPTAINLSAGPSRNKRMNCTGDTSFTIDTGSPEGDFTLLINPNNHAISWPGNVLFEGGSAPTLTGTVERGVKLFYAGA